MKESLFKAHERTNRRGHQPCECSKTGHLSSFWWNLRVSGALIVAWYQPERDPTTKVLNKHDDSEKTQMDPLLQAVRKAEHT